MKLEIKGDIIRNDDKWVYDWLELDSACPRDVHDTLERANGQPVEVYINSGGGDVFAGSEIYEALRAYPGGVHIHVVGLAASAASVIACAGKSDIAPTAMVMVHNVSSTARGDYNVMDHTSEVLQKANKAIAAAYTAKTGKPEAEVLAMMDRETWMTAQDAVAAGLVDAVSPGFDRLVASGPGTLPPEVIERIKASVKDPFHTEPPDQRVRAEIHLLKLRGETT